MELYKSIFNNNSDWVKSKQSISPGYFSDLSKGQSPEILYIGCSDSRVTAEEITGVQPGQMFVHRNIANLVPNNDSSSEAVVEYAVAHLKVRHVVVCGHYLCGGVKAAMESKDLGVLNSWLRNIRDVYRLHSEELNAMEDQNLRYNRLVELNVQEQCINIVKMAVVQKTYLKARLPMIHGWVFDISTGRLIDLHVDLEKILGHIQQIYNLQSEV